MRGTVQGTEKDFFPVKYLRGHVLNVHGFDEPWSGEVDDVLSRDNTDIIGISGIVKM